MSDRTDLRTEVILLFENFEKFLQSEEFGKDLRNELSKNYKHYLQVIQKRKSDMAITDHGIVIAGTSSF